MGGCIHRVLYYCQIWFIYDINSKIYAITVSEIYLYGSNVISANRCNICSTAGVTSRDRHFATEAAIK